MPTRSEQAKATFDAGYSCSQALLAAYAERYGLDLHQARGIAAPFGAGISRQGQICGAVSGALMVIGLHEWDDDQDIRSNKERIYQRSREFMGRFAARHGSVQCSPLIHLDWNDPEQVQLARQDGRFNTICPALVQDAVALLEEFTEHL
jgi:C_GCAxxG_C_C family probable redox protein